MKYIIIIWYLIGVISILLYIKKTNKGLTIGDVFTSLVFGVTGILVPIVWGFVTWSKKNENGKK